MKKYRFENFNVELVNPTIEKVGNNGFANGDEFVTVWANLYTGGATLYRVELGQMENFDGWGDEDVMDFAVAQLETFLVAE
jgi:hypothetical protein